MMKTNLIFIFLFIVLFLSCTKKNKYEKRHIYDPHKVFIGDSILINNYINKIVFADTSYGIDSIVFNWYDNSYGHNLSSIHTFKGGKNIFENIEYYDNGYIKKYSFIDEDSSYYYYERLYDRNGLLKKVIGYLFFQGNIIDTISKTLDIKKGSTINYLIYYPNPPDCETHLYIKNDDGSIYNVFQKSTFLNFLQTVYQDNNKLGVYKVNVELEQKDISRDTTIQYNKAFIFKVIP